MTEKLDVVIPTKGEWTLPYCTRSARHSIPIRNLILVVPSFFKEEAEKYGATVVVFDEKNVGKARNEGLKLVETPIYVSIDADVQVTPEWFKWCWQTIQQPDVAACQGYAKTQAKYYVPIQMEYIRQGGKYGEGFCCLGNTLLKTEIVRKVGMPLIPVEEDWELRLRIEKAGYKWISNLDIACPHLKTDLDVWKHAVWWGKMGGGVDIARSFARIPYYLTFGMRSRPAGQNLFLIGQNLSLLYGRFLKIMRGR
nr:glycosyltransferase [Candidatus Njordarchaeum guaymaensis]